MYHQNAGSIQQNTPPAYSSSGCKCWVNDKTGIARVERSYTGVAGGTQGAATGTRTENRGGGVIVTVTTYSLYLTGGAASAVNGHENTHMASTAGIYGSTIALAESAANANRSSAPLTYGTTSRECIAQLRSLIDWDNRLSSFTKQDVAANRPGGTVDQAFRGTIADYNVVAWDTGPAMETEATHYYDVAGQSH